MYIVKRSFLIIILIKVYIIITVLINNNTFHKVKLSATATRDNGNREWTFTK